jgi:chromosome segregation ATPase
MRTISVKEAAQALGISTRAVTYRLEKGDLNGHQTPNPYGVKEWRIYPTKEIVQKLKLGKESEPTEIDFEPVNEEAIDAESVSEETTAEKPQPTSWVEAERQQLRMLAEEMMRPLLDTIRDQERRLEDQSRQIRLLPDLEKQAEAERKAAELKELEAEALRKQISALKIEQEEAEAARLKVESLEQALEQSQREAEAEIKKLKADKEAQIAAVQEQLKALADTVQDLKKPFWKKWFAPAE